MDRFPVMKRWMRGHRGRKALSALRGNVRHHCAPNYYVKIEEEPSRLYGSADATASAMVDAASASGGEHSE